MLCRMSEAGHVSVAVQLRFPAWRLRSICHMTPHGRLPMLCCAVLKKKVTLSPAEPCRLTRGWSEWHFHALICQKMWVFTWWWRRRVGAYSRPPYESVPACFSFFSSLLPLHTLNNTEGFSRADVFIFCLISPECWLHGLEMMILPVGLLFHGIWFIGRNRRWLFHNQGEGVRRRARGFLYPVIPLLTKGKQRGQIRGKQLLVRNSGAKWSVYALLDFLLLPPAWSQRPLGAAPSYRTARYTGRRQLVALALVNVLKLRCK